MVMLAFGVVLVGATASRAQDIDVDGWDASEGDCCEDVATCPNPAVVNPGALEIPFNGLDDDCDPATPDGSVAPTCSAAPIFGSVTPDDLAEAMELCVHTEAFPANPEDRTWGVIEAEFSAAGVLPAVGQVVDMSDVQTAVLADYGLSVTALQGATMAGLSSGTMRDLNDPGFVSPNPGTNLGWTNDPPFSYLAAHGGSLPGSAGCSGACPSGSGANDAVSLDLTLRVPTNVDSFSYRFKFTTADYQWACDVYNDYHLALVDSAASGIPADGNIAFDALQNPVSVNNAFFEVCDPMSCYTCPSGIADLIGTGMGLVPFDGAATEWLAATAPVVPGEIIDLQLMVFDVSDNIGDSSVLLDDFRWHPMCGNGNLDSGEQCDDGNAISGDGCSAACESEACGNGFLDPGEECDDGNELDGDGCSASCTLEECGNGILDFGEECDDGNLLSGDGCSPVCTLESGGLLKDQEQSLKKAQQAQEKADAAQVKACDVMQDEIAALLAASIAVPLELEDLFFANCL